MSTPSPDSLLNDIKSWTTEKTKLVIRQLDNPNAYFSMRVSPPEPHIIIPITIAYPKGADWIMIGWNWTPEELDKKAYAAFKDRGRKESVMRAIKDACTARGLTLGVDPPDIDHLEKMAITTKIPVKDVTKEKYRKTMLDLMLMWDI